MNAKTLGVMVSVTALAWACSEDHEHGGTMTGHTSEFPSCQAIIDACHPLDVGDGPIHDCHDVASAGPEASCAAKKTECLATCTKKDGG
jgi:hypothetical protein